MRRNMRRGGLRRRADSISDHEFELELCCGEEDYETYVKMLENGWVGDFYGHTELWMYKTICRIDYAPHVMNEGDIWVAIFAEFNPDNPSAGYNVGIDMYAPVDFDLGSYIREQAGDDVIYLSDNPQGFIRALRSFQEEAMGAPAGEYNDLVIGQCEMAIMYAEAIDSATPTGSNVSLTDIYNQFCSATRLSRRRARRRYM